MVAGRRIRFTAVLVAVVFALTGFSSHGGSSGSGSSGKSKSKSGGGGGCSSSKSRNKSHGSGGRSTATATATPSTSASGAPATAVVVTCVGDTPPVTTVRITSNVDRRATFAVNLYRVGANGATIESTVVQETLGARESRVVGVALEEVARAGEVTACRLDRPVESSDNGTPGPARTTTSGGSRPTPGSTPPSTSTSKKPGPKSTRKP